MYDLGQFAIRLKAERVNKGWTQAKLAKVSGVNVSSIRHYENCGTNPRLDNAIFLAEALHVPLNYLSGEEYIL